MTLWYYNILYSLDMTCVCVVPSIYSPCSKRIPSQPAPSPLALQDPATLGWPPPKADSCQMLLQPTSGQALKVGRCPLSKVKPEALEASDQADHQPSPAPFRPLYPRSVWHSAHRWPGVGPRWFSMDIFCGSPNWTHVAQDGTCEWSPRALGRRWKQTHVVQGDSTRTIRLTANWSNLQRLEANPLMVRCEGPVIGLPPSGWQEDKWANVLPGAPVAVPCATFASRAIQLCVRLDGEAIFHHQRSLNQLIPASALWLMNSKWCRWNGAQWTHWTHPFSPTGVSIQGSQ